MAEPALLNIDTLIVRPTISIDGQSYELLSPDEISVADSQRFALWGADIQAMSGDEAKAEELAALVDKTARMVAVGVPDQVMAKLSGAHRMSIVEVFTSLLLRRKMGVVAAIKVAMEGQPTGVKPSLASSASTAAILAGGSTTHP